MDKIKFIHISDPHILIKYEKPEYLKILTEKGFSPTKSLQNSLDYINASYENLDFVLISGDLTHDGCKDDYRLFRNIIEKKLHCPVFVALGNHDSPEPFRQGYLNESGCGKPYYDTGTIKGYRIIILDSSAGKEDSGSIDKEQLEWLRGVLKAPSENGSILVLHHPPVFELKEGMLRFGLKNPGELLSCVQNSDVRAVFSGHTHGCSAMMFGNIPLYIADSTAFGVSFSLGNMNITNHRGYSYCIMQKEAVYVEYNSIPDTRMIMQSMAPYIK